jgi:serralysin
MAHIDGTSDDDVLGALDGASDESDLIHGWGGNDTIYAWGGHDQIEGHHGSDVLYGHEGNDVIFGGSVDDEVDDVQPWEFDYLDGDVGDDTLCGGNGPDILIGGRGTDTAVYAESASAVSVNLAVGAGWWGSAEGDLLSSIENLGGSLFNDVLTGNTLQNVLFGNNGNDTLIGDAGADTLSGGEGMDTASYSGSSVGVTVVLYSGLTNNGDAEGDVLSSIENLTGSNFADGLLGDSGVNYLTGLNGDDTLKGFGGADTLDGGIGNDTLHGGAGADTLDGFLGSDTAAYDESPVGVSIALLTGTAHFGDAQGDTFSMIENLTGSGHADGLAGDDGANVLRGRNGNDDIKGFGGVDTLWGENGHDELYGMDDPDTLYGGDGNDYLDGGVGADTMGGGLDSDIYVVDNANDSVNEPAGQGLDEVRISTSWTLTAGADVETLRTTNDAGTGAINLTGNSSGNHIIGNDGMNIINGGGGVDQMSGRGGTDIYYVDHANDSVSESGGAGADIVRTSVSWTLTPGADVETLRTTGDAGQAAINLTGNSTGNAITGNAGSNVINGGGGNDFLTGLGGQDSFLFNTILNAAANLDHITDFNVADDTIRLDQTIFSSSLGLGTLAGSQFVIGPAASDANHRIIYDSASGDLLYDSDGTGASAAIRFAQVSTGLALTNSDFFVV